MGRTALGMLQEAITLNNREISSFSTTDVNKELVETISTNVVQQTEEMVWLQENQQKIKEYTDKTVYERCNELDWYILNFDGVKETVNSYIGIQSEIEELLKERKKFIDKIWETNKLISEMTFFEKIIHRKKIKRFKQFLEFLTMMDFAATRP